MKKRKECVISKEKFKLLEGAFEIGSEKKKISVIDEIEKLGWKVLKDWKKDDEERLIFDVVNNTTKELIKDVNLKSFLTSLERDKKLKQLGL
jgi:hypothetical protein